jgi:hypothetical protein
MNKTTDIVTPDTIDAIAMRCHERNRKFCEEHGDHSQVAWADAPDWQKDSARHGVQAALDGATPEQLHESWCDEKLANGWIYGETKDATAKTHPCLVPYSALPAEQQEKDHLFASTVAETVAEIFGH